MTVINVTVGSVTHLSAVVATKVTSTADVRVAVSTDPTLSGAQFFGPVTPDAGGLFAKVGVTGLDPSTRYYFGVEHDGALDGSFRGQFLTCPVAGQPGSFTIGLAGDGGLEPDAPGVGAVLASDRQSNSTIYDTIRQRALDEDWVSFVHLGDLHYYDLGSGSHGIVGGGSLANYRRAIDDTLLQPLQHALYRQVGWVYTWDDHDFGPNDSDGTLATKANAAQAFRERVPHHTLALGSGPIYRAFRVGRVDIVIWDCRYNRDPNSDPDNAGKSMLGTAQRTWFDEHLRDTDAEALILISSSQWMGLTSDSWDSFQNERDLLAQIIEDRGWRDRVVMAYADRHAIGLDSGANNQWGGWPVLQAASMDAAPSVAGAGPQFDVVPDEPGRRQYGTIEVQDSGSRIVIRMTAYRDNEVLGTYQHGIVVDRYPVPPDTISDAISGSHRMLVDARVVETYQTGADPTGMTIPILAGDVRLDGSAKVRGTLSLTTDGSGRFDPEVVFPRGKNRLLAPYGNELFVRRGVGLGSTVLWVPLGYYRIDDTEQSDAADGTIRLSCSDRMATIIDARLLEPRLFRSSRTVASVVHELVSEVYPDAVVTFDDDSGTRALGREIVVEESRYDALLDIATSLGKIFHWDGFGFLQFLTAPDPDQPAFTIRAGHDGVLVTSRRRLSRDGVYNAVVATGEGTDAVNPVVGVAVDNNQSSPTYFYGRFGPVPRYYKSPLIVTETQAITAAEAMLQRILGLPYSVDFGSIVNPMLEPYEAARIIQNDGTRDLHILDRVSIPLEADRRQDATTREQTIR